MQTGSAVPFEAGLCHDKSNTAAHIGHADLLLMLLHR